MTSSHRQILNPAPPWTRLDLGLVAILVVAAGALRFIGLNEGLWYDEIETLLKFIPLTAGEIFGNYQSRNNHIFYSLLAHYSVGWFSESAWALRLPAALFGVATIPATYYLGRQLAPRHEALLASALLTASYHHVWFSQNARGYTGLLLGTVLLSSCFIRLLVKEKPGYRTVFAYALIAALASWIHLTAALVVVAHGIIWLTVVFPLPGKERATFKGPAAIAMLLAGLFSLALYSPLLATLPDWFPAPVEIPENRMAWHSIDWVLTEVWNAALIAIPGGWPVITLGALAMVAGSWAYWKQGAVFAAILLLPMLVTAMITNRYSILFPRFLFGSMVFFLLIAVRGGFVISRAVIPWLNIRQLMIIGLFVVLASAARVPAAWKPKQDFVAAAKFIDTYRADGDAVMCIYHAFEPLHDYVGLDCNQIDTLSELNSVEETHARIWILYTFPDLLGYREPDIWGKIQSEYTPVTIFGSTVGNGEISILLKLSGGDQSDQKTTPLLISSGGVGDQGFEAPVLGQSNIEPIE